MEKENDIIKSFLGKLRDAEWGISVSVGAYLILIVIGMIFSFCYYLPYKINIFKFSDINDFILIPFADPFILFFVSVSLGFIYVLYLWNEWWKKSNPASFRKWNLWLSFGRVDTYSEKYKKNEPKLFIYAVAIYVIYAATLYSSHKEKKVLENQTFVEYKVNFEGDLPVKDSLTFLGDNANYYFLYHIRTKESYVIPKDKLNYLKIKKNPSGRFF
jgi:hypothetical protein